MPLAQKIVPIFGERADYPLTTPPLHAKITEITHTFCGHGGIGRLGGFRFHCFGVQVRVLLPAPYRVFITDFSYGHSFFVISSFFLMYYAVF